MSKSGSDVSCRNSMGRTIIIHLTDLIRFSISGFPLIVEESSELNAFLSISEPFWKHILFRKWVIDLIVLAFCSGDFFRSNEILLKRQQ